MRRRQRPRAVEEPRTAPAAEELWSAPELASLYVLDAAIAASAVAVGAVYPEMRDNDPDDSTESLRAALVVLDDAHRLASSVARYRRVLRQLRDRRDRADDDPF